MRLTISILLIILSTFLSLAQNKAIIDSLNHLLENEKEDTSKVILIRGLFWNYIYNVPEKAKELSLEQLKLSKRQNFKGGEADSYNQLGIYYDVTGDFKKAVEYYQKAIVLYEEIKNIRALGYCCNNIGLVCKNQGNYAKALNFYFQALSQFEKVKSEIDIALAFSNIGMVYYWLDDINQSLNYHYKSYELNKKLDSRVGMARNMNSLGMCYIKRGELDKSLNYYLQAKKLEETLSRLQPLAYVLNNIGTVFTKRKEYDEARSYYLRSLEYFEKLDEKAGITMCLFNIGSDHLRMENYTKAMEYFERSFVIARGIGDNLGIKDTSEKLAKIHARAGQYKQAYEYYQLYSQFTDTIFNEDKSKEIGRLEAKYEFEKAETDKKIAKEEQARLAAEARSRKDNLQYMGILIVLILVFIGVFVLARASIPVKVVEGFVFFSFLLLFEFVLVLLDPQIEQYTGGEPIYKLIINACLAGLIFPLHQLFENKLTKRATRNKRKKWSSGVKGMMLIGLVTINSFSPLVANGRAYSIADSGAKMNALDSLEQQFVEAKSDSIKVLILLAITEIHMKASSQDAFTYGLQSLELSNKIGFNKGKAESLLSLAHAHDNDGNYEGAKQYCLQAIQVYQLDSNHNQVSRTLNFIGRINSTQGEYKNALEYKFKSLRILEDLGKKIESINLIAKQHISLGNTYKDLGNQDLAMNYYLKALKFFKELDDSAGIVSCFNKIGLAHLGTRDYDSSLKYHNRAYKIAMRNEDKDGIKRSLNFLGICLMSQDSFAKAIEYFQILRDIQLSSNNMMFAVGLSHNIATLYMLQGEIDIAIKTYKECIEISAMNDDKGQLIATLSNLSDTYATLGKLKLAESSLVKAYSLSQKSNSIIGVKKIALKLSKIYEKTHEYDNAYHYYMQYNTAKDSLFNEETSKAIGKLEAKYEFEKAEAERKQIELQQALIQAESIARRDNLQYSGAFIFIILILIVVGFSGWLHIPVKVAEGLVFFTFLLLFEFLLVYLDPYIEAFTSEPAIKLAINAALAGAIFPLHSFFESNLKKRIIKAQRKKIRIRMEQFRKDVEEL